MVEINLNSIVPQPVPGETIDLNFVKSQEVLTEEAQSERTRRYMDQAKELLNTNEDDIRMRIKKGDEEGLRLDLVSAMEQRELLNREKAIGEVAKAKGRSLSPAEFEAMVRNAPTLDPSIAPESEYAKHYLKVLDDNESAISKQFAQADPESQKEAKRVADIAHDFTTKVAQVKRWKEKAESAYKSQSWAGWGVDQLKSVIPGYTDYYMRGNVPGVGMVDGGLSRSANYREQQKELFRKPMSEFNSILENRMNDYMATNPSLALEFITAMEGHSATENALANAGLALDYFGLPGASSVGKAMTKMFSKAAKDVVKSAADNGASKIAAKAAAGDLEGSAIDKAAEQIVRNSKGAEYTVAKDSLDKLPSVLRNDQKDFMANPPTRLAEHLVDRLNNLWNRASDSLVKAIDDKVAISRTPILQAAEEVVRENIAQAMMTKHVSIAEQMFDISAPIFDKATTTLSVDIKFGDSTGRLFTSPNTAQQFIREHGLLGAKVEQQGMRFYVKLNQNVVETDNWVKDLLAKTKITKDPDSILNAWVGAYRNPDDILSNFNRLERKLAVFGQNNMLAAAKDIAKSFKDLKTGVIARDADGNVTERIFRIGAKNKERWDQLQRTFIANRHMPDPNNPDVPGYMFKSTDELDHFYMNSYGRLPDAVETEAYFAFKTITEMDRIVRNLLVLRNMQRSGMEKHRIYLRDTQQAKIFTNTFNGAKRDHLPAANDTVAIIGNTLENLQVANASELSKSSTKFFKQLNEDIKAGKKTVIELWDPENLPLENIPGLHDSMPKWVVLDKVDTMPLDFEQVPRRFGGHFEYAYDQYIKQAKIIQEKVRGRTTNRYIGDTTVMPVGIRQMGKDVAKKLDDIRLLLKNKDVAAAEKYFEDFAPVGLSWREVHQWFKPTVKDGVKKPAMLSLDEPIVLVNRDTKIADLDRDAISKRYMDQRGFSTFIDETTGGSPARRMQVAYTDKRDARDLYTITNKGTRDNPLYNYEPAKFVDPLSTMDRAYSSVANSAFMDDYKIASVDSWIEQARPYMRVEENQIRQAPFYFFHNADQYWSKGADPVVRRNLENSRWQIQQFLGVRTWQDNVLHSAAQKLADSMYNANFKQVIDPVWVLPKLKDPLRFMRGMAFHMKLGMFAVPQFIVQAQSWVNIAAIGGLGKAGQAVPGSAFSRFAMINSDPKILAHMDKMMTKFGWKQGEWLESHEALARTGFHHVGNEVAVRDDHLAPRLIRSTWANTLDWGTVFFTEGERSSRLGAWHVAYKEFRDKVPFGKLTDDNIKEILSRADDLTINMTRASSSALHQGILSIPTQFLSYQIRLAEMMWGKRLSVMEKARVIGFQSFAYGIPIVPGVFGLPLTDEIRKSGLENGYIVGENWINSVLNEGVPAAMIAMVTGKGDMSKGNWYNVQDRFGPQGFETLRELFRSDKSWWEIIGGPSMSVAGGLWNAGWDTMQEVVMSGVRGDGRLVKVLPQHVLDIAKEISSVNLAWRTLAAVNTGRWFSKNEQYLSDVSTGSALFMGATGLQPTSVSDAFLKSVSLKDKKEFETEMEKKFIKEFRRYLNTAPADTQQAHVYLERAFAIMDTHLPVEQRLGIIAKAFKDHESLDKRIDMQFYLRNISPGKHKELLDAFERKNKLQNEGLR